MKLIGAASKANGWNVNLGEAARIWKVSVALVWKASGFWRGGVKNISLLGLDKLGGL